MAACSFDLTAWLDFLICILFGCDSTDFVAPGDQVASCATDAKRDYSIHEIEFASKTTAQDQKAKKASDFFLPVMLERMVSCRLRKQAKREEQRAERRYADIERAGLLAGGK